MKAIVITALCGTVLCCIASGCNVAGILAYKMSGPEAIPAKFEPAEKMTLVLVENYQSESSTLTDSDLLARYLVDQLEAHKTFPVVPLDKLRELRDSAGPKYHSLSIATLAKATSAEQVLYVQ